MGKKPFEKAREAAEKVVAAVAPVQDFVRRMLEDLGIEAEPGERPRLPKRGAPFNVYYDRAYRALQQGVPLEIVYKRFLEEAKIIGPDKGVRANFMKAMRRRARRWP